MLNSNNNDNGIKKSIGLISKKKDKYSIEYWKKESRLNGV